jgi:hypothetical protein
MDPCWVLTPHSLVILKAPTEFQQQDILYAREASIYAVKLLGLKYALSPPTRAGGTAAMLASTPKVEIVGSRPPKPVASSALVSLHEWKPMGPPPLVIYQSFPMHSHHHNDSNQGCCVLRQKCLRVRMLQEFMAMPKLVLQSPNR